MCYCGTDYSFEECCNLLLTEKKEASSAEELMRSRYSAYVVTNANYLINTTHPKYRHLYSKKSILQWSKENTWQNLEILLAQEKRVVFKAYYLDSSGKEVAHYEDSNFEILGGKWYYLTGVYE